MSTFAYIVNMVKLWPRSDFEVFFLNMKNSSSVLAEKLAEELAEIEWSRFAGTQLYYFSF